MLRATLTKTLLIVLAVVLGLVVGIGGFTFGYGDGFSYLRDNPAACANCHVMQGHFDSWQHSSHHAVTGCNGCHTPHHPLMKWLVKADNGFFHSLAFTLDDFHEPIRIKSRNRKVTLGTCLSCHEGLVHPLLNDLENLDEVSCVRCHADVGHALR